MEGTLGFWKQARTVQCTVKRANLNLVSLVTAHLSSAKAIVPLPLPSAIFHASPPIPFPSSMDTTLFTLEQTANGTPQTANGRTVPSRFSDQLVS